MKRPTMRDVPEELDGMIPPSLIPANADPVALVHAIRGMAPEVNDLLAATSVAHHWGSKRMPGDWALLYLAWIHRPGRGGQRGVDEEKALDAGIIGAVTTPIGPSEGAPFRCRHHPTLWTVWG